MFVEKEKTVGFIVTLIESKMKKGINKDIPVFIPGIITAQEVVDSFRKKNITMSFFQMKQSLYHFSVA